MRNEMMNEEVGLYTNVEEKRAQSAEIARLTEEFLAKGGEIEVCPPQYSYLEKKYQSRALNIKEDYQPHQVTMGMENVIETLF